MKFKLRVCQIASSQRQTFLYVPLHAIFSVIAVSITFSGLTACSTGQPYQNTMEAIDYALFSWRSFDDTNPFDQQSDADAEQARIGFEECIEELSASLARINHQRPRLRFTREERLLKVVECMRKKGWTPVEDIVVITSH